MSVLKTYGEDISFRPSTTYEIKENRIEGRIDGLDAVKQAVSLALSIERFEHLIYSLDYGNELKSFIGKPREYVNGDIERRVMEALKEDDRIESVTDFELTFIGEAATISFTINSSFGSFETERIVNIGG